MLKKIIFLYYQHFRFIIALNIVVSIYFTYLFWDKGYTHYPLYMLALLFKLIAYAISIFVEKLFFESRSYHYRNLRFSYRILFSGIFLVDFLLFATLLLITGTWKSFM